MLEAYVDIILRCVPFFPAFSPQRQVPRGSCFPVFPREQQVWNIIWKQLPPKPHPSVSNDSRVWMTEVHSSSTARSDKINCSRGRIRGSLQVLTFPSNSKHVKKAEHILQRLPTTNPQKRHSCTFQIPTAGWSIRIDNYDTTSNNVGIK